MRKLFLFSFLFLFSLQTISIQTFAADQLEEDDVSEQTEEDSVWTKVKKMGTKAFEQSKEAANDLGEKLEETKEFRESSRWTVLGNYSLIDTWIPSKYGIGVAYIPSVDTTWELEYLRGSVSFEFFIKDLGKMTDERLTLLRRFYSDRNSFNFFTGIAYHSFSIHLGDRLTSLVTGGYVPSVDLITIKTLGVTFGLGNRWQLASGWVLGADWLSIYIPLKTLEAEAPYISSNASESGKNDVRDVMKVIKRVPTFAVIKFQVGMSF
ncbi:MAG: hypothetical protein M9962_04530 [Oligoflexia bacterium]|nr:hypothetical protein [Oligoflexia bacterium]